MVFPKDEGVGELEEWGNSNWAEHQFWKKCFLNFLGKKTPKTTTFPSSDSISASLTNWNEKKKFGKPIEQFHARASKKKGFGV